MEIKKNSIIELKIDTLTYGGRGIGKYNNLVTFVPLTVPGDVVSARVVTKKPNYLEADLVEVKEASSLRSSPRCPLFGTCGGCSWQNIPYDTQIAFKEEIARSSLEHIARQKSFTLHPIIPSPIQWRYRNKVDYTFGRDNEGNTVLGFHKPGSFYEILDVRECHLQPEVFDALVEEMRMYAREKRLVPYDPQTHEGHLRHVILRCAGETEPGSPASILAILLTGEEDLPDREELLKRLRSRCPSLKGFIHGLNPGKADIAKMDRILFQWGEDYLTENICDLKIRISAFSFFQTNTKSAERLYGKTRDFLCLTGKESLLDAYCGIGCIGLVCARGAKCVYGIEIVKEAVWDARLNAASNNLTNCLFLNGEFRKRIPILLHRFPHGFQRIAVDPPRGGLDKKSLRELVDLKAPVLVYVSCNPVTFARDAEVICRDGYSLTDVQPVDMFPQTFHIELVARFEFTPSSSSPKSRSCD